MAIVNSYVKLPEGIFSMNIRKTQCIRNIADVDDLGYPLSNKPLGMMV